MNVRIFWVCAMKCMCAQTRPRFILSSERVFGGMEFEPMLTSREKIPSTEKFPQRRIEPATLWIVSPNMNTSFKSLVWLYQDFKHGLPHSRQTAMEDSGQTVVLVPVAVDMSMLLFLVVGWLPAWCLINMMIWRGRSAQTVVCAATLR